MTETTQDESLDLLSALKEKLQEHELDAIVIPHDDEYLSGDLTPDCERIATLTNFTGSAGFVCVTVTQKEEFPVQISSIKDEHELITIDRAQAVFVDGRYKVQVKEQVDDAIYNTFNFAEVSPCNYLIAVLPKKAKVGIDLRCISYQYYKQLQKELALSGIELISLEENLFDLVWKDRPSPVCAPIEIYPDEFNGCPSLPPELS